MLLSIKIVSSSKNRTRVRIIALKDEELNAFDNLIQGWSDCELIEQMEANRVSRSILFYHDDKENEILDFALQNNWIKYESTNVSKLPPPGRRQWSALPRIRTKLRDHIKNVDGKIRDYTDGEYDFESVIALALIGMSVYQTFRRHKFLPAGEVLLNNGLNMLLNMDGESDG